MHKTRSKKNNINLIINNFALGDYEGKINFDDYRVYKNKKFDCTNEIIEIKKITHLHNFYLS